MFSSLKNLLLSLLIGLGILTPTPKPPEPYLASFGEVAVVEAEQKANKVIEADVTGEYSDKEGRAITVESVSKISGGVEVFVKAQKGGKKLAFGADGTVEIERFRFFNVPVMVDDPNGPIETLSIDSNGNTRIVRVREDPEAAFQKYLSETIALTEKDNKKMVAGKRGNTTSTFFSVSGANSPLDGYAGHDQNTSGWSGTRDGAGNDNSEITTLGLRTFKIGTEFQNARIFTLFDTSAIPDGDTISSATWSLAADGGGVSNPDTMTYSMQACTPSSDSNLSNSDYTAMTINSPTEFITRVAYSSWTDTAGTYNNHTVNASGIASISKTGITKFCWRNASRDIDNVAPTGDNNVIARAADTAGGATPPKLVVVHAAAANNVPNYWGMF